MRVQSEFAKKFAILLFDLAKAFLRVMYEVHFVYGDEQMADAEEGSDKCVPLRLRQQPFRSIDENHCQIGGRSAGRHVSCVLFMARCVRDDELSPRRAEIPVSDVNRDALLAFGAQAIREQRKIDRLTRTIHRALFHRCELVLIDGLAVMQKPSDQRGLAVIHAARRSESQQLLAEFLLEEPIDSFMRQDCGSSRHQK